jgi:hypothetical protein
MNPYQLIVKSIDPVDRGSHAISISSGTLRVVRTVERSWKRLALVLQRRPIS